MSSILTLCASLGCGLMAGVFWAFSNFVMPALARLPAAQGVAAMQSINLTVLNRRFLGVLFGTALSCVVLALDALRGGWADWPRLAGSSLYLVGTILVTKLCHVPRNDALAGTDAGSPEAARLWPRYVAEWCAWNHVRGAASLGAALLLLMAELLVGECGR